MYKTCFKPHPDLILILAKWLQDYDDSESGPNIFTPAEINSSVLL